VSIVCTKLLASNKKYSKHFHIYFKPLGAQETTEMPETDYTIRLWAKCAAGATWSSFCDLLRAQQITRQRGSASVDRSQQTCSSSTNPLYVMYPDVLGFDDLTHVAIISELADHRLPLGWPRISATLLLAYTSLILYMIHIIVCLKSQSAQNFERCGGPLKRSSRYCLSKKKSARGCFDRDFLPFAGYPEF
jgi:hypothetical protein